MGFFFDDKVARGFTFRLSHRKTTHRDSNALSVRNNHMLSYKAELLYYTRCGGLKSRCGFCLEIQFLNTWLVRFIITS